MTTTIPDDIAMRLKHFDELHDASDDPWDVRTRWYERRKAALILAAIGRPHHGRILDLGCSNGEVTAALATRADELVAVDGSANAVRCARERLAGHRHVLVQQRVLPHDWPDGTFDLIVISELAYYLSSGDRGGLYRRALQALCDGGEIVLSHWKQKADDAECSGLDVLAEFTILAQREGGIAPSIRIDDADFVLGAWCRTQASRAARADA